MDLQKIGDVIVDGGLGQKGRDLFIYQMPPDVTQGILVRGNYNGSPINWEMPEYFHDEFQIVIRAKTVDAGLRLADAVSALLTISNRTIGGAMDVKFIRPRHKPVVFPRSDGSNVEFSINFDAVYGIM